MTAPATATTTPANPVATVAPTPPLPPTPPSGALGLYRCVIVSYTLVHAVGLFTDLCRSPYSALYAPHEAGAWTHCAEEPDLELISLGKRRRLGPPSGWIDHRAAPGPGRQSYRTGDRDAVQPDWTGRTTTTQR